MLEIIANLIPDFIWNIWNSLLPDYRHVEDSLRHDSRYPDRCFFNVF